MKKWQKVNPLKKITKCLKSTLEYSQKLCLYKVKFPKLQRKGLPWVPRVFDQKIIRKCYLYILEVNGYVLFSIPRLLLFFEFLQRKLLKYRYLTKWQTTQYNVKTQELIKDHQI